MGKNMPQLLKDQFEKVCWVMICIVTLAIFIFPSCATKKDQSIQDSEKKQPQSTKTESKAIIKQTKNNKIITEVKLSHKPTSFEVIIEGNKDLKYTSIKQSFPFGIAIYLPDTSLGEEVVSITSETGSISNIIPSYADKDKKTSKIEILLNEDLPYDIKKESGNLVVIIPNENKIAKSGDSKVNSLKKDKTISNNKLIIPKGVANVADIEFSVEDEGYTELKLITSHPIRYDFSKGSKGILYLNLYRTNIPNRHNRPFETKYFKSAVYKVLPIRKTENSKNSKIEISMREKVPYQVVQNDNTIIVRFEPSSIEPPKFAKADKTVSTKIDNKRDAEPPRPEIISQTTINPATDNPELIANSSNTIQRPLISSQKPKPLDISPINESFTRQKPTYNKASDKEVYSGEKIKLDFYETDIKNVFRILSSIGNTNFAIDKDVTGSVTLTLDNPIPWDQVLDLVLSMNQLGKMRNGNVIRIATQDTLAAEAEQKHAKFQAMQKAKAAEKALQPMITEYIPINYANASSDIMPHIEKILTEERGTVSVDERTNMIIITDLREIVNKAKELIYTLDNVTPQIMISAKIVEANKEFENALGLGLSAGFTADATTAPADSYTSAVNYVTAGLTSSFTFNHLSNSTFGGGAAFLTATINASESRGDVTVLSSPKILTLDNKKAKIKQGLEYPYVVVDADGLATVLFKDIDLLLEVTPHVTPDKRISMEIFVTKNEIAGEFVLGVPPISTNEATTTLLVNNNDTIVIGGVLKAFEREEEDGIPWLMRIPILGYLFKVDRKEKTKQELLIFLTPTIVQLKQIRNTAAESNEEID